MGGLFTSAPSLTDVLSQFAPKPPSFGAFASGMGSAPAAPSSTFGLFSKPDVGSVTPGGAFRISGFGPQGNPIYESTSPGAFTSMQPPTQAAKYKPTRASTSQVKYGGSIPSMGGAVGPLEFSRGQAPTLGELQVPYEDFTKRLSEVNQPEQLAGLAERYNAPTRQAFESYLPQFRPSLAALGNLAYDYLGARIPSSVAQGIARSTAATNLQTGLAGGGLGRGLTARDFGLTALNLQQTGADLLGRSVGLTQQAMQLASPVSVANLMVSPQQVFDTLTSQAQYNQQIANANLLNAWQSQPLPGQYVLGRGFQTFTPGQYSPTRPTDPRMAGIRYAPAGSIVGNYQRSMASNWTGYTPQQQLYGA